VCGESFEIEPTSGCSCPQCGRHYEPQAFAAKFADTMTFSGDDTPVLRRDAESQPSDPLIGTHRGHFRIVARLGEGGMGNVYQAVDESLQRYVALKVIRPQPAARQSLFEQLVREARAQARVNHPNIAHIYYVGESGDTPFFAMELIPGRTLAERLVEGPLPFGNVVRIGLQVASALERAAHFDIVHGDIKPSNILEADPQTVKISDFGLSRRLSGSAEDGDRIAGTPNYLSPEIIRGETPDTRSDIYSLGVTLFELTFGKLPFQLSGSTLRERLDAHLTQTPKFPEPWPETIPEGWRDVLGRMLAKDPAARYPDYTALTADLYRLLPKRPIRAARITRAIAWCVDAAILTVVHGLVVGPSMVLNNIEISSSMVVWKWTASVVGTALAGLLLVGLVAIQCRWGATPGKMFLQLAIVDGHGLRPSRRVLALRSLIQFPWVAYFFSPLLGAVGLNLIDNLLSGATALVIWANAILLVVRRDERTLHDWLLKTQVVVQTGDD
jgi:uncharacterized RDD family membrane protein YckC